VVPGSGGTITYGFAAANSHAGAVTFDAWTEIRPFADPTYWRGPLWLRENLALSPLDSVVRTVPQPVPAELPAGYYYVYGYAGDFATRQIYDMDCFSFTKVGAEDGGASVSRRIVPPGGAETAPPPESFSLSVSPNPFNPATTITLTLPQAGPVEVEVYDLAGRNVGFATNSGPFGGETDLQWMETGTHTLTFDGSDLPSGVYLLRVEMSGLRQPRLQNGVAGFSAGPMEGRAPSCPTGLDQPRLQEVRKLVLVR
jgi:hypothetical protein